MLHKSIGDKMEKYSDEFDITFSFPKFHPMFDDVEQQILAPLSCLRQVGSEWILEIDLPLVDKKDISVSLDDNTITIESESFERTTHTDRTHRCTTSTWSSTVKSP